MSSSRTPPTAMKSFTMETEMLESQVRKLQIENSRLQSENNILKNKYSRAQSRISFLEEQLLQGGALDQNDFSNFAASSLDRVGQQQIMNLKNEIDQLKNENISLEMQLRSARVTGSSSGHAGVDMGRVVEGFTREINALKDELTTAKQLIREAERHNQSELDRSKEMGADLRKLTELKTLLQEEVHGGSSGCVAEKLVRSLSERLKVTEDRLHNERADRATKLSDVEEKLLKENARLQVSEKELVRQLNREKERHRNTDVKMKEYREKVEKLQISLSSAKPNLVNNKQLRAGIGTKKQKEEVNVIMEEIKRELNLGPGQEPEIIWLLWQQNEEFSRNVKEMEVGLDVLRIDYGDIRKGLQALRDEKELYEERLTHHKHLIEDLKKEKGDLNNIYKQQIKQLTEEKRQNHVKAQNLDDLAAALSAENEALKSTLMSESGAGGRSGHGYDEAKTTSLQYELQSMQTDLQKHQRSVKLLESQVQSLKSQLAAKDVSFPALMEALRNLGSDKIIIKSNAQQTYNSSAIDEVDRTLARDGEVSDLHEREREVYNLSISQKESERELLRVQDDLIQQKNIVMERNRELDQLQLDLQRKSRSLDQINRLDAEQSLLIETLQENLSAVNAELDEKNKLLKMKESYLDAEVKKNKQLAKDVRSRDDLLSENIAKVLDEGKLTSPLGNYKHNAPPKDIDAKARLLEYERNTAQADVKRAQESMENIAAENTELLGRLRNMRQDLVKERATVCQLTSDKVEAEQKLRICVEERNDALKEKQRLEQRLARHEATTMKTVQKLEADHQRITEDHVQKYHSLDTEGKKLALELGTAQRLLEAREKEIELLKTDVEHKSHDISDLERQLKMIKEENQATRDEMDNVSSQLSHKLSEEKLNQGQILEKLSSTSHQVELVKRDYDTINANLDHEKRTADNLRESLKMVEDKNLQLDAKATALRHELENAKRHAEENKGIAEQFKKEKQVLYEDVQDLCLKLSEKDKMIAELQDKCDSTVENIHKDLTSEKSLIQQQREKLAQELSQTRQELGDAKDQLRHKELQLQAYTHTNRHLEQETMHRQEAEKQLDKVEDELLQNKREVSKLGLENKRLVDENGHLKEICDKLERNVGQLKDQLHQQRDELTSERQKLQKGLSKDLTNLQSQQSDLEEHLNRNQAELKSTKSSLASALDAKDALQANNKDQEREIEKLKSLLAGEAAEKKMADRQLKDKMAQIADLKEAKRDLEDQLANAQIKLVKTEADLQGEKERHKKLKNDLANAKSSSNSQESQNQALYMRIAELEGEVARLSSQAETVKQNLEGKNRRLALELKQLMENQDKERNKLIQQAQQLSQDLEVARESSAAKSRENLGLQEDIMNKEAKARDLATDLKRTNGELKKEKDKREELEQKNHQLQLDLIKARPPGEGDNDNSESTRMEVNKMMTDLSRSMQQQLEAQKSADKESRDKDLKNMEDFKKKIAQVESALGQEQALHMITKTQLDSVNEDNTRLRHQLHQARKKNPGGAEERSKSRADEINELINRSQSRAQQMLASGMYGPTSPHSVADPLHVVTASRDFGAYSNVPVMMMTSPLSRSMMSDEILGASSPHDPGHK